MGAACRRSCEAGAIRHGRVIASSIPMAVVRVIRGGCCQPDEADRCEPVPLTAWLDAALTVAAVSVALVLAR